MAEVIWENAQEWRVEKKSMFRDMDLRDLPDRLKRAGRSQSDLAAFLRLDPSSLTKTIKGSRRLKAELLQIEEFFEDADASPADVSEPIALRRRPTARRIPVYGYAAAGPNDAIVFNSGQVVDWIDPPPLWNGTGDLVAIRVLGSSMEPRLFAGEMIVAQLGLPPQRDRDCIIEMNDGSALVKTYQAQRDGKVYARQWNPDSEVKIEGASVRALHAVVWRR